MIFNNTGQIIFHLQLIKPPERMSKEGAFPRSFSFDLQCTLGFHSQLCHTLCYLLPLMISTCPAHPKRATAASGENSDEGELSHQPEMPGNGSGHQCDPGQLYSWGSHR